MEELKEDLMTCLEPSRMNELPFELPIDDEATKAIPVIKEEKSFTDIQDTIVNNNTNKKATKKNELTKNVDHQTEKPKKKKKWPIVLILLSMLIVVAGVLALTVLPEVFGSKDIEVPDVTNIETDDAILELEESGFVVGDLLEMYHDEIPKNHVIKTNPPGGRLKVEGSEIALYVSIGKEPIELKDYQGKHYDDVLADIQSEGLKFNNIEMKEVYHESKKEQLLNKSQRRTQNSCLKKQNLFSR